MTNVNTPIHWFSVMADMNVMRMLPCSIFLGQMSFIMAQTVPNSAFLFWSR
jgi:hypothetical protein